MARIYSEASQVLVWLGFEHSSIVQRGLRLTCRISNQGRLENAHNGKHASYLWEGAKINCDDDEPLQLDKVHQHADFKYVDLMLACQFFTRGWVFQEIVLSSKAIFHWGEGCIEISHLLGLAKSLEFSPLNALHEGLRGWGTLRAMFTCLLMINQSPLSLSKQVSLVQDMSFTDTKDYIYGALGLMTRNLDPSEREKFIKPDYAITTMECYTRFAETALLEHGDINILSHVQRSQATRHLNESWPSWVPDWRVIGPAFQIEDYDASSGEPPKTSKGVDKDSRCIMIRGIDIDSVDTIVGVHGDRQQDQELLRGLRDRYDDLTISTLATAGHGIHTAALIEDKTALNTHVSEFKQYLDTNDIWKDDTPESTFENIYHRNMMPFRAIFSTVSGSLCLGTEEVQPGDVLVILFGASLPSILRPVGKMWKFVGQCYVNGMMFGDATVHYRNSGVPPFDFALI
jgi:hypothetical protein